MEVNMESNHKILAICIFLLGVLTLVAVACQLTPAKPLTAEEIVAQSNAKMKDVKTMHFNMDVSTEVSGMAITITSTGVAEQPDKAYMTMEAMGQKVEVLVLSKTEVYMREGNSTSWTPVPADQLSQVGTNTDVMAQLQITDMANNIVKAEDEKIDGVDCYHLTFDIDLKKYFEKVNPSMAEQIQVGDNPGKGELWVGKADMLNRKLTMNASFTTQGTEATLDMTMTATDFNKPVDIPQP
jgi:outer membrane lipoprotein-sorting protein